MFTHMAPPTHLSVSPPPPPAGPPPPQQARVPSPQEMTVLTQQIMQQALIKRKLEEQKENFRRRQGDSEPPTSATAPVTSAISQSVAAVSSSMATSGSPLLAFTPTSVMRKNAAERKDSDPFTKGAGPATVPELKVTPQKDGQQAGRRVGSPSHLPLLGEQSPRARRRGRGLIVLSLAREWWQEEDDSPPSRWLLSTPCSPLTSLTTTLSSTSRTIPWVTSVTPCSVKPTPWHSSRWPLLAS